MEAEGADRSARYRHLEPPIPLDQMIESVDVAERASGQDDAYRDQEWLIRNAIG